MVNLSRFTKPLEQPRWQVPREQFSVERFVCPCIKIQNAHNALPRQSHVNLTCSRKKGRIVRVFYNRDYLMMTLNNKKLANML